MYFRSLPHVRGNQSSYSATGNPVYARDMLLFPTEGDNCKLGNYESLCTGCLRYQSYRSCKLILE